MTTRQVIQRSPLVISANTTLAAPLLTWTATPQLESMIRLSEALARLHCEKEIKVKYVDEAKRLLKMSIINVKSSDVSLDDFDAPDADEDDEAPAGGGGGGGDDDDDQGGDGGDGGDKDGQDGADKTPSRRGKRGREEEAASRDKAQAKAAAKPAASPAKSPAKGSGGAAAPAPKKRKLEMKQEEFDLIAIRVMGLLQAREERGEDEYVQADLVDSYLDQVPFTCSGRLCRGWGCEREREARTRARGGVPEICVVRTPTIIVGVGRPCSANRPCM